MTMNDSYLSIVFDLDQVEEPIKINYKYKKYMLTKVNGKVVFIMFLSGNIESKYNALKNIDTEDLNRYDDKIAVYLGIIDSKIKNFCKIYKIRLAKTIILRNNYENITIKCNENRIIGNNKDKRVRRSKNDIIKSILETVRGESSNITNIVYKNNLNYVYCTKVIDNLIENKMLDDYFDNNSIKYRITDKGLAYLKKLSEL